MSLLSDYDAKFDVSGDDKADFTDLLLFPKNYGKEV